MFPSPYVPQSLCSPVHLFPSPRNVHQSLCSPVPMFPKLIHQSLCSPLQFHRSFHPLYSPNWNMFPSPYVPQCLCSPKMFPSPYVPPTSSAAPMFPSHIPQKCFPFPMFPKHVPQSLCSPVSIWTGEYLWGAWGMETLMCNIGTGEHIWENWDWKQFWRRWGLGT